MPPVHHKHWTSLCDPMIKISSKDLQQSWARFGPTDWKSWHFVRILLNLVLKCYTWQINSKQKQKYFASHSPCDGDGAELSADCRWSEHLKWGMSSCRTVCWLVDRSLDGALQPTAGAMFRNWTPWEEPWWRSRSTTACHYGNQSHDAHRLFGGVAVCFDD